MDTQLLVTAGLQPLQAKAYALLLETGGITPPEAASKLKLSRSNAYKILDRLTEMSLAEKVESKKKFIYIPNNPMALTGIVREARNQVTAREEAVKRAMNQLLARYYEKTEQPSIKVVTGREEVANAFRQQIDLRQPVYFIRSQADIPVMGFETMHELRVKPAHYGQERFGITPDITKGAVNPESDKRSRLTRTWVKNEDYDAPVEWSVSGDMLLIVLFGSEPHAISIVSPLIADAFRQLWQLLNHCLISMPYYAQLPRTDSKAIKP